MIRRIPVLAVALLCATRVFASDATPDISGFLDEVSAFSNAEKPPCHSVSHPEKRDCSPYTEQDIRALIATPFEKRFSVITPDIPKQSQKNLDALLALLRKTRPGFDQYLVKARQVLNDYDGLMDVTHQTRPGSALAIIRSGELLSQDELLRRGDDSILKSDFPKANYSIDGKLGETDAIFLAIQDPNHLRFSFGEVTFTFDKDRALEKGYFTAFPFDSGPIHFSDPVHPSRCDNVSEIQKAAPLYRDLLFQGKDAYKEFLTLSIAHYLWEMDQDFSKVDAGLAKLREKSESAIFKAEIGEGDNSRPLDPKEAQTDLGPLFKQLGQIYPNGTPIRPEFVDHDLAQSQLDRRAGMYGKADQATGTFTAFPQAEKGLPPLLAKDWGFWELKIPRSVSLDLVKKISLRLPDKNSNGGVQLEQEQELETAIQNYARAHGRQVEKVLAPDRIVFRLSDPH